MPRSGHSLPVAVSGIALLFLTCMQPSLGDEPYSRRLVNRPADAQKQALNQLDRYLRVVGQTQAKPHNAYRICDAGQTEISRREQTKGGPREAGPLQQRAAHAGHVRPAVHTDQHRSSSPHPVTHRIVDDGAQPREKKRSADAQGAIDQIHANCADGDLYPSAAKCKSCHPDHYREWSVSPHAYAQLSPVFNAMSSALIALNNGTLGDFCIRCHTPVGMALDEPIVISNVDRHPAAREGVTCVVCHRVNQNWGKGAGRKALLAGGVTAPVVGPVGSEILDEVISNPDRYGRLRTHPHSAEDGREIHDSVMPFFALTTPAVCGTCHDVFAPNGFRLEDAFSEFKVSPSALKKKQNCQNCHMGLSPGVATGFAYEPAAKVGNVYTAPRKRTNHMMIGPDYSLVHPGIFPHNPVAVRETHAASGNGIDLGLATMSEWLLFDHKAGWGTEAFERAKHSESEFPTPWKDQARRFRARDILRDQFQLLHEANVARHQILSLGYQLGEVELDGFDRHNLRFKILLWNGTDGHGVPTGFDAERVVFLRVTVTDSNGKLLLVSGDLDPNGDVRDSHSAYVHDGELPIDRQLFTLQSRFLTRNVRGGEREQTIPVPFSLDPLPFIRPATRPFTVQGRPLGARKHKKALEVGGKRWARYSIPRSRLEDCAGPYCVQVQLVAGMVPVNLIQKIGAVGFDYGMSTRDVADAIVDGHLVLHSRRASIRRP